MVGLWFVGATIERVFGRRRFLLLFLATGLAGNLLLAALIALGLPVVGEGCGDSVLALFVALGVAYGRTPIRVWGQLVLQARVLAWILIGMSVLSMLLQGAWPYLLSMLVAIGLAYLLAGGQLGPVRDFLRRLGGRRRTGLGVLEGGRSKRRKDYLN